jgi:hypothetical protein
MIVDRRKDSYDELQILAGDVRSRRRRANMVTTLLITGGIVGTIAYIATMNAQVDALTGERDQLAQILRDVEPRIAEMQVNLYRENADRFALVAGGQDINPVFNLPELPVTIDEPQPVTPPLQFSNLVWVVEGSRRFPMAIGDVLWIPEAQLWVRLEAANSISMHEGSPGSTPADEIVVIGDVSQPSKFPINAGRNSQGVANCLSLGLGKTTRPGFGDGYYDMDVRVFSDNCV